MIYVGEILWDRSAYISEKGRDVSILTLQINIHSRLSPQIFEKIRNDPNGMLRGPGDTDLWKNLKSKISYQTPF